MTQFNFSLPDREDFKRWLTELKVEILTELKHELTNRKDESRMYYTRKELAERYKISLVTLHNLTLNGLPSVKVGRRRLYVAKDVESYFDQVNKK